VTYFAVRNPALNRSTKAAERQLKNKKSYCKASETKEERNKNR
jgi:hypothetical protein